MTAVEEARVALYARVLHREGCASGWTQYPGVVVPCNCGEVFATKNLLDALIAAVRAEERARCAEIVEAEEELDGEMPDLVFASLKTRDGATETMRDVVRVTKRNILAALITGAPTDASPT